MEAPDDLRDAEDRQASGAALPRRLLGGLRRQLPGAMVGALFTAAISFVVWALAYYGDINLHLPSRLAYQSVDRYIRSNLPSGYSYGVDQISNFRGTGSPTLLVWANDPAVYGIPSVRSKNGILLFLDESGTGDYRIDFRFELEAPTVYPVPEQFPAEPDDQFSFSYVLVRPVTADLTGDGSNEVIAQWSPYTGAGSHPLVALIFGIQNGELRIQPLDVDPVGGFYHPQVRYIEDYASLHIWNLFNPTQQFIVRPYQLLGLAKSQLFALYRTDQTCDACSHSYLAQTYFPDVLDNEQFVYPGETKDFASDASVNEVMDIIGAN